MGGAGASLSYACQAPVTMLSSHGGCLTCNDNVSLKVRTGSRKDIGLGSVPFWLWGSYSAPLIWKGREQVPSCSILSFTPCYPFLIEFSPSPKVNFSGQERALDMSGTRSHGYLLNAGSSQPAFQSVMELPSASGTLPRAALGLRDPPLNCTWPLGPSPRAALSL